MSPKCVCSYILFFRKRCVCGLRLLLAVCMHGLRVRSHMCWKWGYICTGREPVNKSVWGLGVWGWNMVPGMWSNVKNSATPGNNKSPGVASPQNKYTPLCKSSIWTMSRHKDAPDTSPAHPLTHTTASAHASSAGPTQLYLFTRLFICLFVELNEKCLWGTGKYYLVIYYYTGPLRSNTHRHTDARTHNLGILVVS